jgi:O-antigen ligase
VRAAFDPDTSSSLPALATLAVLALVSPWAFGAVQPAALGSLVVAALGACALALGRAALRGRAAVPDVPLWPLAGFLALALAQLVPLPPVVHALLAPGSNAVWHPEEPAAVALLGAGWRPLSVDPDTTLRAAALVAALGTLAAVSAPALARRGVARGASVAVALAGAALAGYAIFARARFGALLYGTIPVPTVSPFGPFVNKNHFAGWAVVAALVVAGAASGCADEARRRGRDWTAGGEAARVVALVVCAAALALAVVASLSRGGVAALAAGALALLVLLVAERRARGAARLVPALALAAALAVTIVALAPPAAQGRLRTLAGASFRVETWHGALRLAAESPLAGHGLGAFHDAYPRRKTGHGLLRVEHAENDYLETLAETGVLGLALAAGGLLLLMRATLRGLQEGGDAVVAGAARGAVAALVAVAAHAAVDFNLRIPSNAALAALAAAFAAAGAGLRPRPLARPLAVGLSLGAAVLLAAVAAQPRAPWREAREEARLAGQAASPPVRALRLERAEARLVAVVGRRPAHAETWLMLAGVRAARGDAAGAAGLARHAAGLDPARPELQAAAQAMLLRASP